jgi:hypothetical protein
LEIDYVALIQSAGGTSTLQTAYDGGRTINTTLPVAATSTENNATMVVANIPDNTSEVLQVYNVSTVNAPSLGLYGQAGANEYGHELRTDTTASLRSTFNGYSTSIFDAYSKVSKSEVEGGLRAECMCEAANSDQSGSAFLRLRSEYGVDADYITADLQANDIDIVATGDNGGVFIQSSGDNAPISVTPNLSFGTSDKTITYASSVDVDLAQSCPIQHCTLTGNISSVVVTKPLGVGAGYAILFTASGGDRTITEFYDSVTNANFIKWIGGDGNPDSGALSIPSGQTAVVSLIYYDIGSSPMAIGSFNLQI